ncbi:MAG: ribosome recycling factor [Fusobacteriaceae bacterium]|jgi:ribosome recycling factor|nr:ribosome recycling factor [Fusobacteriaceae bacterium]
MPQTILADAREKMDKAVEATKHKFASIRAGRANVSMLDGIKVNQYGSDMPLNQVANLSAPEARLLVIDPWDKSIIKEIEKVIVNSNLGLTPNNDGKVIRLQIPELTAERRKEYAKLAKKEAEEGKVAIRNVRKDTNNKLRKLEKDSEITEDDLKRYEADVQKLTDEYIKKIDELYAKKEKEITTV